MTNLEKIRDITDYLVPRLSSEIRRTDLLCSIFMFAEKFSISAMYRFLEYANKNDLSDDMIVSTLVHDINGRNDICFLPRTDSY